MALRAYNRKHGEPITQKELASLVIKTTHSIATKKLWINQWGKGKMLNRITHQIVMEIVKVTGVTYGGLIGVQHKATPCCYRTAGKILATTLAEQKQTTFVEAVTKVCNKFEVSPEFIFTELLDDASCNCKTK